MSIARPCISGTSSLAATSADVATPSGVPAAAAPAVAPAAVPPAAAVSRAYMIAKRLIDIIGALGALAFLALPMALVAALIKLESRGPVFFAQPRIGEGGVPFQFIKFRSMVVDAERIRADLQSENEVTGPVFKIRRDPRITRVGRLIRRTSLDETPQLFHVLTGKMSLVGPRPPLPEEVANYEPWQLERLAVRPGLTCIWQISGRSDIPFERWVELDIEYVRRRNLWLDLKILFLTVPAVLSGRGAY
jgi:lipopolysaccharide/colanic/teichoic acid biosynthesis glycosyltransferase